MPLMIEQKPINPDTRTWLQKLIGKTYMPHYRLMGQDLYAMFREAKRQNDRNSKIWGGQIGHIRIKPPEPVDAQGRGRD